MLPLRLTALAAVCAALGAAGCGGDDKPSESPEARSQDAQAKSDVRNLTANFEACFVDQQSYEPCRAAGALGETGLPLGSRPGQVQIATADTGSYVLVAHSRSGTDFKIAKTPDGKLQKTCDSASTGGCSADGSW